MEPAEINLDDIFAAVTPVQIGTNVTTTAEVTRSRTATAQSHRSNHSAAPSSHVSHHSSHHSAAHSAHGVVTPQPSSLITSTVISEHTIPPEPKSRATTASSTSTIKPVSRAVVQPDQPSGGEDILASVFGGVPSEPAHYNGSDANAHHDAIRHIDDVLNEHDAFSDSYHATSNQSHVSHTSSHQRAASYVANDVVVQSFKALDLNGHNGHNGDYVDYPEEPSADYEDHDKFEPAHLPYTHRAEAHIRPRGMTLDSTVSTNETRHGGFDVHDDNGVELAYEIDLHHDEVAYQRPARKVVKGQSAAPISGSTGGTMKLIKLNQEVADARHRQAMLTAQIERERAAIERLRQQNLASEAAHRAAGRTGAPANRSQSVTSYGSSGTSPYTSSAGIKSSSRTSSYVPASIVSQYPPVSPDSIYEEEPAKVSEVAGHQKSHGTSIGRINKIELIVPHQEQVVNYSANSKVRKVIIGGDAEPTTEDKTILFFGPVGSGKTSAIVSMLNYLYDVNKGNDFRFVLDGVEPKPSTGLTVYVINNSILPYSVTIVDTPGVVDQKGNKTVSTLIKTWLEQELLDEGAFRLDAISIVLRHDENNLGWPFIYELAAVKRMFGDDLKTNVLPIITNSEVLPQPLAIRSLAHANISFVEYYKVNNIGFMPEAKGLSKLNHNLFFTHAIASMEQFFRDLQELIHPLIAILRSGSARQVLASHGIDDSSLY